MTLKRSGIRFVSLATVAMLVFVGAPSTAGAHPDVSGEDVVGGECQPWEEPSDPTLVCQATDEYVQIGPHVRNARAGDIILSPNCGPVGALLREVDPPQQYSHSGIFVQDFSSIRHSTASEKRITDHPDIDLYLLGVSAGVRDDVVRYGWPGTVTQSVEGAFRGEMMDDPAGEAYEIFGFSAAPEWCDGDPLREGDSGDLSPVAEVPPLLIKPPPCAGSEARQRARDVAAEATAIEAHYRFFAYTDAAIALDPAFDAPAEPEWSAGRPATHCSSFVWRAATSAGITMEGAGAEPGERLAASLDGLYRYTPAERLPAGTALHDRISRNAAQTIQEIIASEAPWIISSDVEGMADEIGNVFASCFWDDSCKRDVEGWRWDPRDGVSVSPEDLRQWDSPLATFGAVYGHEEPVFYRDGADVVRHVWGERSEETARVTVLVRDPAGHPVPFADVQIGPASVLADATGEAQAEIPLGRYVVSSFRVRDGNLLEGALDPFEVKESMTLNVDLAPQDEGHRDLIVDGDLLLVDWDGSAIRRRAHVHAAEYHDRFTDGDPSTPEREPITTIIDTRDIENGCVGEEVSAKYIIQSQLNEADNSLHVTIRQELFEDHDDTEACLQIGDAERWSVEEVTVEAGATVEVSMWNRVASDAKVEATLKLENRYQTFDPTTFTQEACRP